MTGKESFWIYDKARDLFDGKSEKVSRFLEQNLPTRRRLPSEAENCAITLAIPKTVALCYDRVWGWTPDIPEEIRFFGDTVYQRELVVSHLVAWEVEEHPEKFRIFGQNPHELFGAVICDRFQRMVGKTYNMAPGKDLALYQHVEQLLSFNKSVALAFSDTYHVPVVPVYPFASTRDHDYSPGDQHVVISTLSDLGIAKEEDLTWDQVLEFRRDTVSRKKYRRLCTGSTERWSASPRHSYRMRLRSV